MECINLYVPCITWRYYVMVYHPKKRILLIEFSIKRVISNDAFLRQFLSGRLQVKKLENRILHIIVFVSKKTKSQKQNRIKLLRSKITHFKLVLIIITSFRNIKFQLILISEVKIAWSYLCWREETVDIDKKKKKETKKKHDYWADKLSFLSFFITCLILL